MGEKSRHGALFKPRELKIMDGYICLYRKMLDWEWFKEPLTAHLFTCLLLMANQEEGWRYKGVALHAGQFVTSLAKLAKSSGLSVKEVRKRLERLQESGELEVVCDSTRNTTITIRNYGFYQYVGENSEGTISGTEKGTISGTKKNSVKGSKRASNKSTTINKGKEKGIIMGTISGTATENQQKNEKKGTISGTEKGTTSGTEKGTIFKAVNNTATKDYKEQGQKEGTISGTISGTEKGTISGKATINIYIDNNIDNIKDKDNIENTEKKKKEKESENTKNAAPTAKELEAMFEAFRKAYKGTKRGFKVEFDNFKKKHQSDWREIVPKLMPALENMEAWRKEQQQAGQFVPPYAMLQTWLNQQRWTTEYELTSKGNGEATGGHAPENSGTVNGYVPNYDEEF